MPNQANTISFSLTMEAGFTNDAVLNFTIEPNDGSQFAGFNNSDLIASLLPDKKAQQYPNNVYVPEAKSAVFRHNPFIYADLISKSPSGLKEVSLRSQEPLYTWEAPTYIFNTPKFTWQTENISLATGFCGNVWAGTSDMTINRIAYTDLYANNVFAMNTVSENYKLYFNPDNNTLFVSGYDNLSKYTVDTYWAGGTDIHLETEIANPNEELFSYANDTTVLSTAAYTGNVIARNTTSLVQTAEFSGFDAPFKIIYSPYHACYLVAGTNFVWKLQMNGTKKAVYGAKDHVIKDIACSPEGQFCVLLHGNNSDAIRLLDNDLYTILAQADISDGYAMFCQYCKDGLFYALVENSKSAQTNGNYNSTSYVLDANLKTITAYPHAGETGQQTINTDTSPIIPQSASLQITYPIGGETFYFGSTHKITWTSTQNISEQVSLELYLGNQKVAVLANQTDNTGELSWNVSSIYPKSSAYRIKISYLTTTGNAEATMSPLPFTIANPAVVPTISQVNDNTSGIAYSSQNNAMVLMLRNGLVGLFDLQQRKFMGMFDSGLRNVISLAAHDPTSLPFTQNQKVRLFVGSAPYLNDKWDSGAVETNCQSMYYGGGDNLLPGENYFANLQIYQEGNGWSEVQTSVITMPL